MLPARARRAEFFSSYVHSYNVGNLNEFNTYLASFPPAVILPDAHTYLPGDAPNRFLAWGAIAFPNKFRVMPKVEYRSGFPWSSYDAGQQYGRSEFHPLPRTASRSTPALPKTSR